MPTDVRKLTNDELDAKLDELRATAPERIAKPTKAPRAKKAKEGASEADVQAAIAALLEGS